MSYASIAFLVGFNLKKVEMAMIFNFVREPSGYLRVDPLPTPEELSRYYSSDYYQNPHGTYSLNYTSEELLHKKVRNQFLFKVATTSIPKDTCQSFLDVGCGEGFLLNTFYEQGWVVTGLDFSEYGITKFNPHLFDQLIVGDVYASLELFTANESKFGCINLGNILEHVLNPIELLVKIQGLMLENGSLLITVPNDFSKIQALLKEKGLIQNDYWVAPPDHLNYFSRASLVEVARLARLNPIDVYADFPIEWYLANDLSNYQHDLSRGKAAHNARVILDTFISSSEDFEAVKLFWSSLAKIGHGRNITLVSTTGSLK